MPHTPIPPEDSFMSSGNRAGHITKNRSFLFAITALLLLIPAGAIYNPGEATKSYSAMGRDFGDPGNDTGVQSVNSHAEGMSYGFTAQEINITLANYNTSFQRAVDVNLTVKDRDSGIFEEAANTSGNISGLQLPKNGTRGHIFWWTPSHEGNFQIHITSGNATTWVDDVGPENNNFTVNVSIQNMTDVKAEISGMAEGQEFQIGSIAVSAWINNTGNVNITEDFDVSLVITNKSTNATDFTDTKSIYGSTTPLNYGQGRQVSFSSWTPADSGQYLVKVTTLLPGDENAANNISSVTVNITPVYFYDFEVTVSPTEQYGEPGGSPVQITFTIRNTATLSDSYDYFIQSGRGWLMGDNPTTGTTNQVAPGGTAAVSVFVLVPPGTGFEIIDGVNITATSNGNVSLYRENVSYIYTYEEHDVEVTLLSAAAFGDPGDNVDYKFRVMNLGNMGMNFSLLLSTSPSKWTAEVKGKDEPYTTAFIVPGDYEDVTVTVNIPELVYETRIEDHTYAGAISYFTLKAESRHASDSANVITTVNSISRADIWADSGWVEVAPDENTRRVDFNLSVRNINNAKEGGLQSLETIDLSVQTIMFLANWSGRDYDSERWTAETSKSNVSVGGGRIDRTVRLAVYVPRNPFNGSGYISVSAVPRDDPGAQPDYVAVYVHVTQKAGVKVTAQAPTTKEGAPTDVINYNFNVENTGNGMDVILLRPTSENGWDTEVVGDYANVTLDPETPEQIVTVSITVPPYDREDGPNIGDEDRMNLTGTSRFDGSKTDTDTVIARVKQGFGISLDPDVNSSQVETGGSLEYTVNVTNQGNGDDIVDLMEIYTPLPGWTMMLSDTTLPLLKGEMKTVTVTVTAGEAASALDSFLVRIRGTSQGNSSKMDTANITTTVEQYAGINITLLSAPSQMGVPGDDIHFQFEVKNTGNGRDNFTFNTSGGDNWSCSLDQTEKEIYPFLSTVVELTVTIPEIEEGDMEEELRVKEIVADSIKEIKFEATSGPAPTYIALSSVSVTVDSLFDPRISASNTEDDVLPGKSITYRLKVINKGNGLDTIELDNSRSHAGIGILSIMNITLSPGNGANITLTVSPGTNGSYVGEKYINKITPRSGTTDARGEPETFTTTIVFFDLIEPSVPEKNVNISKSGEEQIAVYEFELMNVPEFPGDATTEDTFIVTATTHTGNLKDRGWNYELTDVVSVNDTASVSILSQYGYETFKLKVTAPDNINEIHGEAEIDIKATSQTRPNVHSLISTTTKVVYVDVYFSGDITFNNDEFREGGQLEITATIVAEGTVPISGLKVTLYINDKLVPDDDDILPRFALDSNNDKIQLVKKFTWDVPSLDWDEKAQEYSIVLKLDVENSIYETSSRMDAEANNEASGKILVRDDAVNPILCGVFILLSLIVGFVVYKRLNEDRSLFIIYGILSAIVAGSLFSMPWELISASFAGWFGKSIIWFFLILVFTAVATVLCLNSRSYIEYLINEKARKDRLKYEFFRKDEEGGKKKLGLIPDNVIWKPYLIAGAGAFVQVPIFFLFISIYSGTSIVLTGLLVGIIYLVIACAAVWYFIKYNLDIYEHITGAEKLIDEIREETLGEVRLEVEPMDADGTGRVEPPRRRPPGGRRRRGGRPPRGPPRKGRRPPPGKRRPPRGKRPPGKRGRRPPGGGKRA